MIEEVFHQRRVAVLLTAANNFDRSLYRGVLQYARKAGNWTVNFFPSEYDQLQRTDFAEWSGDGIIGKVRSDDVAIAVLKKKLPMVLTDLRGEYANKKHFLRLPHLLYESEPIGKTAADFFLRQGHKHFAYFQEKSNADWSVRREALFTQLIEDEGYQVHKFQPSATMYSEYLLDINRLVRIDTGPLDDWLRSLPKPTALFAANDCYAGYIRDACLRCGIAIPDEISLLGVGNDWMICEQSSLTLSSIIGNVSSGGYLAADCLDRLMNGETLDEESLMIRFGTPFLIIQRESTNRFKTQDSLVIRALDFISESNGAHINVADVVRHTNVSRRLLEMRFKNALNESIHGIIQRYRIEHVKKMLLETDWSMKQIVESSGFYDRKHMENSFYALTGEKFAQFCREE